MCSRRLESTVQVLTHTGRAGAVPLALGPRQLSTSHCGFGMK